MLKKTIRYTDYNGNEREEDFYFNLTKSELTTMEIETPGGMEKYLTDIINSNDGKQIMNAFRHLLFKSYGEKSPDGKRFIKSEELSTAFEQSMAYDVLFNEFINDAEYAATFFSKVIPKDLAAEIPNSKDNISQRILTNAENNGS